MIKIYMFSIAIILFTLAAPAANAKLFRNAYVQFELPGQWDCQLEGTEWVCASQNKSDSKESIIILTAKEVGPHDTFAAYDSYLRAPKQVPNTTGRPAVSVVKSIRQRKINDHTWVDALHMGSEIPGYYTRYLATIKDKLAILVTLSAHQKYYTKYSSDYFKAVESLRVVASKELFAPRELAPVKPSGESIGGNVNPVIPGGDGADGNGPPPPENESGSGSLFVGAGILLLVAAAYFFLKKKKS